MRLGQSSCGLLALLQEDFPGLVHWAKALLEQLPEALLCVCVCLCSVYCARVYVVCFVCVVCVCSV